MLDTQSTELEARPCGYEAERWAEHAAPRHADPAADRAPDGRGDTELGFSTLSPADALDQAVAALARRFPGRAHRLLRSGTLPVTPVEVGRYFAEVGPI
ncbi:hypothetical protein [Falsiroseomonas sp.]|uniref:hypothetical protein n=1 Tax=Falsiroseomonas sp. TaxID=2870721 RepID=UPI003F720C40